MAKIFASRLKFTLMGAPPESFYIDSIKSILINDSQVNFPFVPLNPLPLVKRYFEYFENIDVEVVYFTERDKPSFDFQSLPRVPGLPIQMSVYKLDSIVATLLNIEYNGSSVISRSPNEPINMVARFKSSRVIYNQFV